MILVTGATGFIGSHTADLLLREGHQVRLIVRSTRNRPNLDLLKQRYAAGVEIAEGDLCDHASVEKALKGVKTVFHVAGFISTLNRDRDQIRRSNVETTRTLVDVLKSRSIDKFVYLASIFALGKGTRERPADENAEYNLTDYDIEYFRAKREEELMMGEAVRGGLPAVFVYPNYCLGPGDVYLSSSRIIYAVLKKQNPVLPPGGFNVMDVRDAAVGLRLGLEKGKIGERYLVGGENVTFAGFLTQAAQMAGVAPPRIRLPASVIRASGRWLEMLSRRPVLDRGSARIISEFWYYDDSKARREWGYRPRPLEETLRDSIDWIRRHFIAAHV